MVKKAQFENSAKLAIQNVIQHGDTDIFPFPSEDGETAFAALCFVVG